MKRLMPIIVIFFIFALATPANAGREPPGIGTHIGIYNDGSISFNANVPFYISHGWCLDIGKAPPAIGVSHAIGVWDFKLFVDGIPVEDGIRYTQTENQDNGGCSQLGYGVVTRTYNFPAGMSGVHTFEGYWIAPCQEDPYNIRECPVPYEPVISRHSTVTIEFSP